LQTPASLSILQSTSVPPTHASSWHFGNFPQLAVADNSMPRPAGAACASVHPALRSGDRAPAAGPPSVDDANADTAANATPQAIPTIVRFMPVSFGNFVAAGAEFLPSATGKA